MIDSRLALLTKTADVPGAIQQQQTGDLNNLLRKAQLDDIPQARENQTRQIDIAETNATNNQNETLLKYEKYLSEQDDKSREEGIRTANQFLQIKSQGDLDIWRANNPVDSEGAPLDFNSPEFQNAYRHSEMLVQAGLKPQAPSPYSQVGKIGEDLKNGFITPEQADEQIASLSAEEDKSFDRATKLRAEYIKGNGEFIKSRDAYNRIQASIKDPSAAGDLALIFNYMKVLDPGSTVREGEFANAENSGGASAKVRNIYNKVRNGERLTPEQRADFANRAGLLFEEQVESQKLLTNEYTRLAQQNNIDPSNVIVDFGGQKGASQAEITQIKDDAEYNSLPSGATFMAPDGTTRVKP